MSLANMTNVLLRLSVHHDNSAIGVRLFVILRQVVSVRQGGFLCLLKTLVAALASLVSTILAAFTAHRKPTKPTKAIT